jgi:hypothetical protein
MHSTGLSNACGNDGKILRMPRVDRGDPLAVGREIASGAVADQDRRRTVMLQVETVVGVAGDIKLFTRIMLPSLAA